MELEKELIADLKFLRARYGWDDDDAREIMASITATGATGKRYYAVLAAAHRAGYEPAWVNGYVRLQPWCVDRGFGDPFARDFNLGALRAAAIKE